MPLTSAREQIGIGRQSAIGSAVALNALHTVVADAGSFTASENYEQILDTGRRGSETMDFNSHQGVGFTEISFDFPLMYGSGTAAANNAGSIVGILLRNLLGTGASGSGATDALRQTRIASTSNWKNQFRLGSSKEYLTVARKILAQNSEATDVEYIGCRVNELTISANSGEGFVTCSTSLTGRTSTTIDMQNQADFLLSTTSEDLQRGWENISVSTWPNKIVGTTVTNIISWDVTFSREATPIFSAGNSQDYSDLYLGPLEVTFSVVCDIEDATQLSAFRANTKGNTQLALSMGAASVTAATNRAFVIGMANSTIMEDALEIDTSGSYATVALSGRGLANGVGVAVIPSGDTFTTSTNLSGVTPVEVLIHEMGVDGTTGPDYS